jgi:nucleoside-diphosphate-sugar epimerase
MRIRVAPSRKFDVPANVLDCRKIKDEMGWCEAIGIDKGIRQTYDWFRDTMIKERLET